MRCNHACKTPVILGYLGLLPFIALTILLLVSADQHALLMQALLSYGAVILTFVGALHWSFAMQLPASENSEQRHWFVWSVLPSLAAWVALLIPQFYGFALLIVFFILALWRDQCLAKKHLLADWYIPLRRVLTLIVVSCLLLALIAVN